MESTWRQNRDACWEQKENKTDTVKTDTVKHTEQKIMEWAKELQTVSEVRTGGCDNVHVVMHKC